jgi:hypothetical protein
MRGTRNPHRILTSKPLSVIIRVIKSRRMRWAGHVARMGEKNIGGKARMKEISGKTKT